MHHVCLNYILQPFPPETSGALYFKHLLKASISIHNSVEVCETETCFQLERVYSEFAGYRYLWGFRETHPGYGQPEGRAPALRHQRDCCRVRIYYHGNQLWSRIIRRRYRIVDVSDFGYLWTPSWSFHHGYADTLLQLEGKIYYYLMSCYPKLRL